jgi:GxxExxY protein
LESKEELLFKNEVYQIIGAAIEVSNNLGGGFLEAVYQEALELEFLDSRIPFESQKEIQIKYKKRILKKKYIADFLCFGELIVEIKAIQTITAIDEAQVLNYIKATQKPLGLVINFGNQKLEWKRFANTKK